ncbi:MAG: hypothetical protein ACI4MK_13245 [Aristaeellaceae bacterium]
MKAMLATPCSEAFGRFLKVYACFAVLIQFQGIFLNTYLIKATGTTQSVMLFNIVLAVIQPFVMLLAVMLIRKTSALFSQRIGLALYAAVFLALCLLGENAVAYIQLIAGVLSAAAGFFYTTYAMQLLGYTTEVNRDACYGIQLALGSLIGLVIPLLTGLMISGFSGFTGYRVLFAVGFSVSLLSLYYSMSLPSFQTANRQKQPELGRALHILLHNRAARAAMTASAANGFYGGTMSFFLNMLMYAMMESEALIGVSTTVCSIAAIASSAIYARIVHVDNRERSVVISVGIMMAVTVLLALRVTVAMIFVYGIILNISCPCRARTRALCLHTAARRARSA